MYFFYVDESGNRDLYYVQKNSKGNKVEKDWLYVLTAISVFEGKWKKFHWNIQNLKHKLGDKIYKNKGIKLELSDFEIKSTWIRKEN